MKIIGPMAGIGARLRPFTYSKPKGLLKVAGKRVIDHILDLLCDITKNSTDLLIVTGYRNRTIKQYLEDNYSKHFNLKFEDQHPKGFIGDIPYYGGLGEAIYLSKGWYTDSIDSYGSNDPEDFSLIFLSDMIPLDGFKGIFNVLCGNNLENIQQNNLADDFKDDNVSKKENNIKKNKNKVICENPDGVIGVMRVPKERANQYGIIELDDSDGTIKSMIEKPAEFISDLAIAGVYAFKPKTMNDLYENLKQEVEQSADSDDEAQFTPALQKLVDNGSKLVTMEFKQGILDFGKPATLLEGNRYLLDTYNNLSGGPVDHITNTSLTSPSFIGSNVQIENCVIGPYCSIGDNCVIRDCILRNVVMGDNCVLENIITKNSIIGDFVTMDDLIKENLIIGDRSNIRSSQE